MVCILCIDDNQDVLGTLGDVLRTSGYSTLTALSGNQGLRSLLQDSVDLVVLDYEMPGMNGDLVAQAIRRSNPKLPIILFTGISDDIPDSVRQNVNGIVYKADSSELLAVVSNLIKSLRRSEKRHEPVLARLPTRANIKFTSPPSNTWTARVEALRNIVAVGNVSSCGEHCEELRIRVPIA